MSQGPRISNTLGAARSFVPAGQIGSSGQSSAQEQPRSPSQHLDMPLRGVIREFAGHLLPSGSQVGLDRIF